MPKSVLDFLGYIFIFGLMNIQETPLNFRHVDFINKKRLLASNPMVFFMIQILDFYISFFFFRYSFIFLFNGFLVILFFLYVFPLFSIFLISCTTCLMCCPPFSSMPLRFIVLIYSRYRVVFQA